MYKRAIIALTVFVLASQSGRCFASWAYVPQEVRMLQADLVVVGKIEKTVKQVEKNGAMFEVGVIKPTAILRGKPAMMDDIRVAWPAPRRGGLRLSTTISYRVGQEGIWVLTADEKLPVYWATYPTDYQRPEDLPTVKKKIANLNSIKWGKPVGSLQIGMIVEQRDLRNSKVNVNGKPVKAVAQLMVYPLLKNVGDGPIYIANTPLDRPIDITFKDPASKPIEVKLYGPGPRREVPIRPSNFFPIKAGQVGTFGYGHGLPMLTESGIYTIEVKFHNERGSGDLKIEPVWQGTASSANVEVKVPAE